MTAVQEKAPVEETPFAFQGERDVAETVRAFLDYLTSKKEQDLMPRSPKQPVEPGKETNMDKPVIAKFSQSVRR